MRLPRPILGSTSAWPAAARFPQGHDMRFASLRSRLIALSLFIVVGAMVTLATTLILADRAALLETHTQDSRELAASEASKIAEWFESRAHAVKSALLATDKDDPVEILRVVQVAGDFEMSLLGYADKRMYSYPAGRRAADFDPTIRSWYTETLKAGGPIISQPRTGASSGALMVTLTQPVRRNGQIIGVVGGNVLLNYIAKTAAAIKPTPESFALVVNAAGQLIAAPDPKLMLKPVSELSPELTPERIRVHEGDMPVVKIGAKHWMLASAAIAGTDWELVIALDRDAALAPIAKQMWLSIGITALVLLGAGILLAWAIGRLTARLDSARLAMAEVANGDGDLSRRLEPQGDDELAQIGKSFNQFADKVSEVIRNIRRSSATVNSASGEIARGTQDLANRTEAQASHLEETAAAMEELAGTVRNTAEISRKAQQLAESASGAAERGGNAAAQVVTTMDEISAASRKITEITSVIEGIAFQTNILALNAAVEAARAGEQGRGFAVVAGEVRSLAQRSAQAAKEIKALLDNSAERVDEGAKQVREAGANMNAIVEEVRQVATLIDEISHGSQQQAAGIGQVHDAIVNLDGMTQQNAALVEESAAAAESLRQQAEELERAIAGFRTEQGPGPLRLATLPPAVPRALDKSPAPLASEAAPARPTPQPTRSEPRPRSEAEWEEF